MNNHGNFHEQNKTQLNFNNIKSESFFYTNKIYIHELEIPHIVYIKQTKFNAFKTLDKHKIRS